MRALVYDDEPRLAADYAEPNPPAGEARVRTTLAGICNTDLEIVRGYMAFEGVLGHEFVGIVDRSDDPTLLGRRVVGEINASCFSCETCLAGRPTHCPQRTTLGILGRDGVLADLFCLPEANLHVVPDAISDEAAVFVEPLAAACQILEQVHVQPSDRVVVLGDGKLGLLVAQVLALTGCDLTVVGRHEEKLAMVGKRGVRTLLADESGSRTGADVVVECTGQAEGFRAARQLVRPRGTLVLKSTYHGDVETDLSDLVVDEISVVGSRCGRFPPALRLLEQGLVDVESLIEAEYRLAEGLSALDHAGRRGSVKILVRP